MKFNPTLLRTETFYVRDYIQYGDGMLVLWKARILYMQGQAGDINKNLAASIIKLSFWGHAFSKLIFYGTFHYIK